MNFLKILYKTGQVMTGNAAKWIRVQTVEPNCYAQIPDQQHTSCMNVSKLPNLSVLQFAHPKIGVRLFLP